MADRKRACFGELGGVLKRVMYTRPFKGAADGRRGGA